MQQYITSDLHFFHKKIALYCDRPYDLNDPNILNKMNEDLLKQFDKLPDESDVVVWNLGDVFFKVAIIKTYMGIRITRLLSANILQET